MNDQAFDRIAEAFMASGPNVVADRVLDAAFEEVHLTRQRRVFVRMPWRLPNMNTYLKFGAAAAIVVAVGAVGLAVMNPAVGPGAADPSPTASASPSASPSESPSPSPSPPPTPSPSPTPAPALTEQFTSTRHGISISYPDGWSTRPATAPWTSGELDYYHESADVLFDPILTDHLWIAIGSQPLGSRTPEAWAAEMRTTFFCESGEPITIAGVPGEICTDGGVASVSDGDRGYVIRLLTSGDEPWLAVTYDRAWFEELLATVELDPASAVDTAP